MRKNYSIEELKTRLKRYCAFQERCHKEVKNKLQKLLEEWMLKTGDPILECFRKREDAAFVEAYVQKLESESEARRKASAPKPKTKKKKKS